MCCVRPSRRERLRQCSDGRIALELKRAWHDGTRELVFEPLEFLERLALTPRPETSLLICHGVPLARACGRVRPGCGSAHGLGGADGPRAGRPGEAEAAARLELGGAGAPGVPRWRPAVPALRWPPAAHRHAARSRGHPEDPRAPGPLLNNGAEP